MKKTAQKKCFLKNHCASACANAGLVIAGNAGLRRRLPTRGDTRLKNICKRVLTVKKSVIRFRPADIAAEESEQNRHQADTLVPDVHRSTVNGGVGFASLQKTQRSFRSRTRVAVRCGCFCIRPVAHHLRTVPDDGMPSRGLLQLGVFQLHSSLTRSQTHGHH